MPSAISPASSKLRGPPIAPSLSGTRSWTGRAAVNRPVYLKNSPWWSILPVSSMVRMTSMPSLTRARGRLPFHSTWYWLSMTRLPKLTTASARPPVSSSRVASCWAIRVGSRRITWVTLGPMRMLRVLSAAAANSSHMSLW